MTDVKVMLVQREGRYGKFAVHAAIAQGLKFQMEQSPNWDNLDTYMAESLHMIQHKIARILNGDPHYEDNWVDIIGYAQLVLDQLEEDNRLRAELEETKYGVAA